MSGKALLNAAHGRLVFGRRVRALSAALGSRLSPGARVLDVGCGDGSVDLAIMAQAPQTHIEGIDVFVRENAKLKTTVFDGMNIPFEDDAFDFTMIVDVLHHTDHPDVLLGEAARVARRGVLVKDHLCENAVDDATLRLMDWVGNAGHGVRLPYNYLGRAQWTALFEKAGVSVDSWDEKIGLYAAPLSWVFERRLHFIGLLRPAGAMRDAA